MSDDRRKRQRLEDVFPGEEHLARLYEQAKDEAPPPALDAAVLAEALRALESPPRIARVSFFPSRKWAVPLALAATFLFFVSTQMTPNFLREARAPHPTALSSLEKPTKQDDSAPQATPPRVQAPAFNFKNKRQAEPLAESPAESEAESERRAMQPRSAPVESRALLAKDKNATTAAAKAESQAPQASGLATPSRAPSAPETKEMFDRDAQQEQALSPEAWVRKINELRRAGKLREAEDNIKQFKQRYPSYPIEKFLEPVTTKAP
jgi:hypothetical protein